MAIMRRKANYFAHCFFVTRTQMIACNARYSVRMASNKQMKTVIKSTNKTRSQSVSSLPIKRSNS
ncbi:hypothetical protein IX95_10755 [Vibrio sp. B183]|nr:hypothetical protein IX95_10755 [Vibrio sp. B183]